MPHANIWQEHAAASASFEQLSKLSDQSSTRSTRQCPDPSKLQPAGKLCSAQPCNSRTAKQEDAFMLTNTDVFGSAWGRSETKAQYKAPPTDYPRRAAMRPDVNQFPKGIYPADYRTTKQLDYQPDVLQRAGPPVKAHKLHDSGNPVPQVVQPDWRTSTQQTYHARSREEVAAAQGRTAGHPRTEPRLFNIITGGSALHDIGWQANKDYRKTR